MEAQTLEMFEVGLCKDDYQFGFLIGQRFSGVINSRLKRDLILQNQLLPFSQTPQAQPFIKALSQTNQTKFPRYWDELLGTAEGSGVPFLHVRFTFIPKTVADTDIDAPDDCSAVLVVSESMAMAAHNEDANVALVGHTYVSVFFIGYTYAGELPSCAFGFNNHGLVKHQLSSKCLRHLR